MDRLLILVIALLGMGILFFAWRGVKLGLRRGIQVEDAIVDGHRPTLLYFHSDDCTPCRWQQGPILASLQQALGESVRFEAYDAVAQPKVARRYHVLTVPTTVVIAPDGQVAAVNYGVTQADKLHHQLTMAATRG